MGTEERKHSRWQLPKRTQRNALICLVLALGTLVLLLQSLDLPRGTQQPSAAYAHLTHARILYSYGLFSNSSSQQSPAELLATMPSDALWVVRHNTRVSSLPSEVVGREGALQDLHLVEEEVPGVTEMFHDLGKKRRVAQSDVARIANVWARGGLYLDVDVVLRAPPPLTAGRVDAFVEHVVDASRLLKEPYVPFAERHPTRVCNYAFAGPARHPFFLRVLRETLKRWEFLRSKEHWTDEDVMAVTGPDVFTNAVHEFEPQEEVMIHSKESTDAVLKHLHYGSWREGLGGRGQWRIFEQMISFFGLRDILVSTNLM
uniref:Alpha 1,4-glycosyltransferase domain-containing protein n=1 Tax=Chromera velia CCMP2878 TaxID=1169474 RepID=A0A0G4H9P2_9ALVE|mmetsp:Transcript_20961/g.41849  ORF Transcript_20961/g.41849 Transcript_20961/m.41849 type:complete len:316 (-) Transcript_20961:90-1037(-)|eukprot:Cvel_6022.t1-p1 / transcript=Cvel_6022.t1 / gene=Cvel_6022 / organism=Chromera_velia_CCMP2878 / gene_product=hypothetical protein / transcript_product=hypothetical protein / location=Cvel_scaffold288:86816-90587(-) / protein_length=315 / sequence_SO=supercontig / SO=protein_coding / is_pseudo=false